MNSQSQLLIDLAQAQPNAVTTSRIQTRLQQPVDWDALLTLAVEHGMLPLVQRGLRQVAPDHVPEAVRRRVTLQLGRTMALTRELNQALDLLANAGIPAITFKGPTLALSAYGDLGLRPFFDLDILVRPGDMCRAQERLAEAGYRPQRQLSWECHLVHQERGTWLDLHQALSHHGIPFDLGFDHFEARAARLDLDGHQVACPDSEDLMLLLCAHLTKDLWDVRSGLVPKIRAIKFFDLAELARRPLDWELVSRRAQQLGCVRILRFALGAVRQLCPLAVPERVLRTLSDTPLRNSFPDAPSTYAFGGARPFSEVEALLFQLRVRDRLRDRAALIFTPTSLDERSLSLPRPLHFLHYLTRPLRMAGRYGRQLLRPGAGPPP